MAPEENNSEPLSEWQYPHFGSIVDIIESHVTKDRSSMDPGLDTMVYKLEEGFLQEDRKWIENVRGARMYSLSDVLYRPDIVIDLVQRIDALLASDKTKGLYVKGTEGVGKSYSLINLTRYLLASNKYWVTIIPDCTSWEFKSDFFYYLLQSVGVDSYRSRFRYDENTDKYFEKIIHDIDLVLSKHGMKWVFVFDQIDYIFGRSEFKKINDVRKLPFPLKIMTKVLKPDRIISIICASGNNEVSHREHHRDFDEFVHPTRLEKEEIKLLYPQAVVAQWDWDKVEYETGRVPLYLRWWNDDRFDYLKEIHGIIRRSLGYFRRDETENWDSCVESAVQYLLHLPLTQPPSYFDRRFSLVQKESTLVPGRDTYNIVPLFPRVETVYRKFFANDLFTFIRERETEILAVCNDPSTTEDLRERLFKEIVIARFVTSDSSADILKILSDANITLDED